MRNQQYTTYRLALCSVRLLLHALSLREAKMTRIILPCPEDLTTRSRVHTQQWTFLVSMTPKTGVRSVANATNGKAIFSVAGEVFLGRKLVQIIANEIEWTYPGVEKKNGNDEAKSPRKTLKSKHLDLEEKIISSSSNKRRSVNYIDKEWSRKRRSTDHDVQEESSTSRSTKPENVVNIIVGDRNDNGKGRADDAIIENIVNDEDENEIEVNSKNYESCDTE